MSHKEQIITKKKEEDEGSAVADQKVWDCGSPLYDSYELASLSHLLDRHMSVFLPAPSSSSYSNHLKTLCKSNSAAGAGSSKGKGLRLWKEKVAARRKMAGRLGHVVLAIWFSVANYRSKRVVPK